MPSDPTLKHLEEHLEGIFDDQLRLQGFLEMERHEVQGWLDNMQQLVDYPYTSPSIRASVISAMIRLSKKSGLHPQCLTLQNVRKVGDFPVAAGGFGDVWKGVIGDSAELVCLKVLKIYLQSDLESLSNEYLGEAILWRQMKHPNILPFLGIYRFECHQQLCLISPWMGNGNLVQFLKKTRREDVNHHTLVHDVAAGLAHLHFMKVVHSDLKGVNILITDSLRARIGDFGLSRIQADTQGLNIMTTSCPHGTGRWLAPELLAGGLATKQSDIYAFGCVCFEIFTNGRHPFPELPNEAAVVLAVALGKRPARPEEAFGLTDAMWNLIEKSWLPNPSRRPNAQQLLGRLSKMNSLKKTTYSTPLDWNESILTQVWGGVKYRFGVGPSSRIHGPNQIPSAPSTSVVNLSPPDRLSPQWGIQRLQLRPRSGLSDTESVIAITKRPFPHIQQGHQIVLIVVAIGVASIGFIRKTLLFACLSGMLALVIVINEYYRTSTTEHSR
ncbi:hypothetical protein PM082_007821 [Marasmius tenuissimus]|nr:hypothetical protein PM082_007821 [Marasmius tenuissimus]